MDPEPCLPYTIVTLVAPALSIFILVIFYFILFYFYFRLNSLAILSVEREVTRMIDFSEAIDRSVTLKTRRVLL